MCNAGCTCVERLTETLRCFLADGKGGIVCGPRRRKITVAPVGGRTVFCGWENSWKQKHYTSNFFAKHTVAHRPTKEGVFTYLVARST